MCSIATSSPSSSVPNTPSDLPEWRSRGASYVRQMLAQGTPARELLEHLRPAIESIGTLDLDGVIDAVRFPTVEDDRAARKRAFVAGCMGALWEAGALVIGRGDDSAPPRAAATSRLRIHPTT